MTFGKNLLTARKKTGLSQERIAEKMGVSRVAVGQWESDTYMPSSEKIPQLADLLGITPDVLFGLRDPGDPLGSLSRKAIVVAKLADQLSESQIDALVQTLEEQKQSNERLLIELLTIRKRLA